MSFPAQILKLPPPRPGDVEAIGTPTSIHHSRHESYTSRIFRGIICAPMLQPCAALPSPFDAGAGPGSRAGATPIGLQGNSRGAPPFGHAGGREGTPGPVLRDGGSAEPSGESPNIPAAGNSVCPKVQTVSPTVAEEEEEEEAGRQGATRCQKNRRRQQDAVNGSTARCISVTSHGEVKAICVKRKPVSPLGVPGLPSHPAPPSSVANIKRGQGELETGQEPQAARSSSRTRQSVPAATASATLSPGGGDVARYMVSPTSPQSLRVPPRDPAQEPTSKRSTGGYETMVFVSQIIYNSPKSAGSASGNNLEGIQNPDKAGEEGIGMTTSRYTSPTGMAHRRSPQPTKKFPSSPPRKEAGEVLPVPKFMVPVIERPRHIRNISGRGLFPPARDAEVVLTMKLKRSPQMVRHASPLSPAISGRRPEQLSTSPEKSERRKNIISPSPSDGAAHGSPRAPVTGPASVYALRASPVLNGSGVDSWVSWLDGGTSSSEGASDHLGSPGLHKRVLSFIISPKAADSDGEGVTDVEDELGSESEKSDSEDGDWDYSSGDTMRAKIAAGRITEAGSEGYSTEDYEEDDQDYYIDSDSQGSPDDFKEASISNLGYGFGRSEAKAHKPDARMGAITSAFSNTQAFPQLPRVGDHIPAFSERGKKYGGKRRPPPSPLGFLLRQGRGRTARRSQEMQQDRTQPRSAIRPASFNRSVAILDDLLARIAEGTENNRDTRASCASGDSLIAKLDQEVERQKRKWSDVRKTLQRDSVTSVGDLGSSPKRSRNLAHRSSLLAKLNSSVGRRLSTARDSLSTLSSGTSGVASVISSTMNASATRKDSGEEAQAGYLQHALWERQNAALNINAINPSTIPRSQDTPAVPVHSLSGEFGTGGAGELGIEERDILVRERVDIEPPVVITGESLLRTFYKQKNLSLFIESDGQEEVGITIETGAELSADGGDRNVEDYEYIEKLPATVYSPSVKSAISVRTCRYSSPLGPAFSLLWNPLHISRERLPGTSGAWLWSKSGQTTLGRDSTVPAALGVRPMPRMAAGTLTISSSSLWRIPMPEFSPPPPPPQAATGIWCSPRQKIPEFRKAIFSLLWNPTKPPPETPEVAKLWSSRPHTSSFVPPKAMDLRRPSQRAPMEPPSISSSRLWVKPPSALSPPPRTAELWRNHKENRLEVIPTPRVSARESKAGRKQKCVSPLEDSAMGELPVLFRMGAEPSYANMV